MRKGLEVDHLQALAVVQRILLGPLPEPVGPGPPDLDRAVTPIETPTPARRASAITATA